jgi:hypothetical protein
MRPRRRRHPFCMGVVDFLHEIGTRVRAVAMPKQDL